MSRFRLWNEFLMQCARETALVRRVLCWAPSTARGVVAPNHTSLLQVRPLRSARHSRAAASSRRPHQCPRPPRPQLGDRRWRARADRSSIARTGRSPYPRRPLIARPLHRNSADATLYLRALTLELVHIYWSYCASPLLLVCFASQWV